MDVCLYDLASLQHRSTDHYENWHAYVIFYGECFSAIVSVVTFHQVALQHFNFFTVQSIAKLPSVPSVQLLGIWLAKRASIPYPVCLCRSDHKVIMLACSRMLIGRANR
ncbi:hypothetical protein TNCV_3391241 [Trichonephila clavipes]|nr:hypothetical protein TNCV_3391241 [Trichonephila clavipes]